MAHNEEALRENTRRSNFARNTAGKMTPHRRWRLTAHQCGIIRNAIKFEILHLPIHASTTNASQYLCNPKNGYCVIRHVGTSVRIRLMESGV